MQNLNILRILYVVNWMRFEWTGTAFYEGSITLSSNKLVSSTCLLTGFFDEKQKWTLQNFPTQIHSLSAMTMTKFYREIDNHYLISKYLVLKQILSND